MIMAVAVVQITVLGVLAIFTGITWSALIGNVKRNARVRENRNGGPFVMVIYGDIERTFPFTGSRVCVGRGLDNDVVIAGPGISRRHIVLSRRRNKYYVTNVDGRTATFIAPARPVAGEVRLERTDQILLGSSDDYAVRVSVHRS